MAESRSSSPTELAATAVAYFDVRDGQYFGVDTTHQLQDPDGRLWYIRFSLSDVNRQNFSLLASLHRKLIHFIKGLSLKGKNNTF